MKDPSLQLEMIVVDSKTRQIYPRTFESDAGIKKLLIKNLQITPQEYVLKLYARKVSY